MLCIRPGAAWCGARQSAGTGGEEGQSSGCVRSSRESILFCLPKEQQLFSWLAAKRL